MIDLMIRRIPFDFEGVDFVWNKANPGFAISMNKVSFFAIGFEKYICQATFGVWHHHVADALARSRTSAAARIFPRMERPL